MKCFFSFMRESLRVAVLHKRRTDEQFLRQANGLGNWVDKGVSSPLESRHDQFVGLKAFH
jgi:hypothetical protein